MRLLLFFMTLLLAVSSFGAEKIVFADKVLVKKKQRKMFLMKNGKAYREYHISLGDNPKGHKRQQGDERTPEGFYVIDYRNPQSSYTLSLHINYPNKNDKLSAKKRAVDPGGQIFIHGSPNGMSLAEPALSKIDWTDGCIAVKNKEIKEIWKLVKNGTPIEIQP
ncbi:MAG TPA: hypothetical protein ENJ60_09135 [Aeromonadales bacterium]|nr:hypothetical protein [Aeromonadales bacterium]